MGGKGLLLLVPTIIFISLYMATFDASISLLYQSARLGYWFTIALFEYYLLYAVFRMLSQMFKRREGIDLLLLVGSIILYFAVTQSVLGRLGISNEMISLLGLDQLRFFFYFAIGTLAKKHFNHLKAFMENGKLIALVIITFLGLFLHVNRENFEFANAMVYHLYNFIGGLLSLFLVFLFFYKYQNLFNTTKAGSIAIHRTAYSCHIHVALLLPATKSAIHRKFLCSTSQPDHRTTLDNEHSTRNNLHIINNKLIN